ncbi:iron ABC transporter permease [Vallitalea pronyensis]|uniref:Iron ABC transporter permease n=1 Tax=Vallitalea pronyensis TaxID=1348613 RepID=A0A8J8MJX7_9FIRM|nr:iron ABC transporter permease [Vallitalea pronyensis]QUI22643.1 iron ABC transporter permease [Vallitalea pronyensis]
MTRLRNLKANINIWWLLSTCFVCLIIIPNMSIFINIFNAPNDHFRHIQKYLLKNYLSNTTILMMGAGLLSIAIGVSLAWVVTMFDFPMKRFFRWALVLPLTIPTYIGAYTYHGLLNYTGLVQRFLRNQLGLQVNQVYFNMMSINGAIFIFTIFLYPYVFIITKSFLEKQSASLIETSRLLGKSHFVIFIKVILPICRGAIIGGTSLVVLEVLNDYGVANYYGIPTFSIAIFKTWFGMGDLDTVVKLSAILMLIIFVLLYVEKLLRGRKRYSYTTSKIQPLQPLKLNGWKKHLAMVVCILIFTLGFFIPLLQLIYWMAISYKNNVNIQVLKLSSTSFLVAFVTASIIIVIATIIANYSRISKGLLSKIYGRITVLGYSIPGAVIAIGVMIFFIGLDRTLYGVYTWFNPTTSKLILTTSIVMLIFAYIIRFLAIGFNPIESGFDKIGKTFHEASRVLGKRMTTTFFKVDMKMIQPAIISGFILIFVDVLKELPLTLLLRPFNFNTLATKTYEYANDEMIHEAAIPSLIIIGIGMLAMLILNKVSTKEVS